MSDCRGPYILLFYVYVYMFVCYVYVYMFMFMLVAPADFESVDNRFSNIFIITEAFFLINIKPI